MIKIQGGTKSQKHRAYSMAEFCVSKLMPRLHYIDLTISIKNLGGEVCGYCMAFDDDSRPDRPRSFEIEVNKTLRLRKLLTTIAHEMVHVKQYARGELYQSCRMRKYRWQGKWQNKNINYWDQPWEIEAHGREAGLFIQWAEKEQIGHLKWTLDD